MFTGIISTIGQVVQVQALGDSAQHGKRLRLEVPTGYLEGVGLGDSIALNGACMTVTSLPDSGTAFTVDVSAESLTKTTGLDKLGPVNLEKAMRIGDPLGGHIVSGHVDGLGQVLALTQTGESWTLGVRVPSSLARFIAYKGSVTLNGVSLTVNTVRDSEAGCEFTINLIPHTIVHTTLGTLTPGTALNVEIDTVARYVERMLHLSANTSPATAKLSS
ncbi:MAG: Riboflavin synthase [Pseudomonadota bacterium]|jgi:riboflavin synthase